MAETDKLYEILNYYGLKTNIEESKKWIKKYVADALTGITTDLMTNVTYNELVSLRDNNNLKPGMLYRMTDYVTKVYSDDESISSAEHPFDLILFANTTNSLNENAFAIQHEGDEYFSDSKLNAWEIKYSIDNNDNRFDYLKSVKNYEALEYIDDNDLPCFYYHIPEFTIDGNYIYTHVSIDDVNEFKEWLENIDESKINFATSFMIPEGSLNIGEEFEARIGYVGISKYSRKYNDDSISDYYEVEKKERWRNYDNNTRLRIVSFTLTTDYTIHENNLHVLNDGFDQTTLFYFYSEELTPNTVLYTGVLDHTEGSGKQIEKFYNLTETDIRLISNSIYTIRFGCGKETREIITPVNLFKGSIISDAKGIIYYMKDEFNNEAPFDFKNILFKDGDYTFGELDVDFSLNGYANGIYNNKILPCVDSETGKQTINKIRVTKKDCHSNYFKPTCENTYINFPISECDISMNNDGELVVFKTSDFISGIENHTIEHDYRKDYLTFEAVNDDTEIIFKESTDNPDGIKTIEVSKDKINWETKTSSYEGTILATLNAGECLYLKGNNSCYSYYDSEYGENVPNFILPLNYCYLYGNVMSIIDSNNFRTLTEITDDYTLYSLFYDYCDENYSGEFILSHPNKKIVLPATTLANFCYADMFESCTNLTSAPELPATILAEGCYSNMFRGCTSLTEAPALPATELADYCYNGMFFNCTSLTSAPELSATTLASNCYRSMFLGCTSLVNAPELPATTLASSCYYYMFNGCTNLTDATALPATTLKSYCYYYMFNGCTSLTAAPALPATTLASYCYQGMFNGCTSLTAAPALPATTLASYCYQGMFYGCTSLTAAPELPATTLTDWCYGYMFGGCMSLTAAPELPAATLVYACYISMFNGCTSLTEAPELPATTLANNCYESMFRGCTSLVNAPELPATTLADYCYRYMFSDCSNLNYIKCFAGSGINQYNTDAWVQGVASSGTFVYNVDAENVWTTGVNGIPNGWVSTIQTDNYITFTSQQDNSDISLNKKSQYQRLWYSENDGETWSKFNTGNTISIDSGESIYVCGIFSGTNATYAEYTNFSINGEIVVSGNLNSLWNFNDLNQPLQQGCAINLFNDCTGLINASGLILGTSATTLANYCYTHMFQDCSRLTEAPALPATTLASGCYEGMFRGCTNLTSTPELPAVTLAPYCCSGMFEGCTSLTDLSGLTIGNSLTTLASNCYQYMFKGCTNLTSTPILPSTNLANYCYREMFNGCTGLTSVPSDLLQSTTLKEWCYNGMFSGCTSLINVPELPSTSLTNANYCYCRMFEGCSSLTSVPYNLLPATILAKDCYWGMFQGCTNLTAAPELPSTGLSIDCYRDMFIGCVNLTTAPDLIATKMYPYCYNAMFSGCTSLNYIKCLAIEYIGQYNTTNNWVVGVPTGNDKTFVKHPDATGWPTGDNGIPVGWNVEDAV